MVRRHPTITKARLVVTRDGERDAMTLQVEGLAEGAFDPSAVEATLREVTKLGGAVVLVTDGALPNDGKVIADERDYAR